MRKIEAAMNNAILNRKDWKSGNTSVRYEAGNCISRVYLHNNLIAEVGDKFIKLHDGGWQSATTKSRLNAILTVHGCSGECIYQRNFEWFVRVNDGTDTMATVPFFSGMRLN
jgi:hypothetical protein